MSPENDISQAIRMKGKEILGLGLAALFALIGTAFAVAAFINWQSTRQLIQTGIETKGVVIDMHHTRDKRGRITTSLAPVVQFVTKEGKSVTYYSQTYTTPAGFAIGESVMLWYLPSDPQHNVTLKGADSWVLSAVLGLFGVVFSFIGYPLLVGSIRQMRKASREPQGV